MRNEPFVQYVYHFDTINSIDVRNMTSAQKEWVEWIVTANLIAINQRQDKVKARKLCEEHFPELLI